MPVKEVKEHALDLASTLAGGQALDGTDAAHVDLSFFPLPDSPTGALGLSFNASPADHVHPAFPASGQVVTITFAMSPYTAAATDWLIKVDCTGGIVVVNLPTAVGIKGKEYIVKKIDATANQVTIDASGAQTIDGVLQVPLVGQWDTWSGVSDNANWMSI
jgi:hypothetical protein